MNLTWRCAHCDTTRDIDMMTDPAISPALMFAPADRDWIAAHTATHLPAPDPEQEWRDACAQWMGRVEWQSIYMPGGLIDHIRSALWHHHWGDRNQSAREAVERAGACVCAVRGDDTDLDHHAAPIHDSLIAAMRLALMSDEMPEHPEIGLQGCESWLYAAWRQLREATP